MERKWKFLTIGVLALLTAPAVAWAHGDYAWINDRNYKSASGSHCCGWGDCKQLDAKDVRPSGSGYATPHGIVPPKGTYQSRDGKIWMCRYWLKSPGDWCLFVPGDS